jgi:hypothetical protein
MNRMLKDEVARRALPPTLPAGLKKEQWNAYRREKIQFFERNVYGITPQAPAEVRAQKGPYERNAWAGKAEHYTATLSFDTPRGEFSFPVDIILPHSDKPLPLLLYASFLPYPNGRYGCIEEIVDRGYAMATFCYNDVTRDEQDFFTSGLAAMYPRRGDGTDWGKIGMWAFAASRVMDYVQTLPEIDPNRIFCVGHSRLGKTALWCAIQDERFAGVESNESGCSGAAVTRGKKGEHIIDIVTRFPFWFCENYFQYANREETMPFDQHQLLALMAPRLLYVASAEGDEWSDAQSEFIGAALASEAYALLGVPGLINPGGEMPGVCEPLHGGRVAYHVRTGLHFMSRYDFGQIMTYLDEKMKA